MILEGVIKDIYDVFCNQYGSNNVDVQEYSMGSFDYKVDAPSLAERCKWYIIVHWDEVEVRNEKDDSVTIWDVYIIVFITTEGELWWQPQLNRSTYNILQYTAGYVHSHVYSRDLSSFQSCRQFSVPCFGSGPIRSTIDKLHNEYDLDIWRLFCWELDKFVHVESLTGGPYIRMENIYKRIGTSEVKLDTYKQANITSDIRTKLLNTLMRLVIDKKIVRYSYVEGCYHVCNDGVRTILAASDAFIKEYNSSQQLRDYLPIDRLKASHFMAKVYYSNGKLYSSIGRLRRFSNANENRTLFSFKGNEVKLKVVGDGEELKEATIISPHLIALVLYNIQKFINVNYGREEIINEENAKII